MGCCKSLHRETESWGRDGEDNEHLVAQIDKGKKLQNSSKDVSLTWNIELNIRGSAVSKKYCQIEVVFLILSEKKIEVFRQKLKAYISSRLTCIWESFKQLATHPSDDWSSPSLPDEDMSSEKKNILCELIDAIGRYPLKSRNEQGTNLKILKPTVTFQRWIHQQKCQSPKTWNKYKDHLILKKVQDLEWQKSKINQLVQIYNKFYKDFKLEAS